MRCSQCYESVAETAEDVQASAWRQVIRMFVTVHSIRGQMICPSRKRGLEAPPNGGIPNFESACCGSAIPMVLQAIAKACLRTVTKVDQPLPQASVRWGVALYPLWQKRVALGRFLRITRSRCASSCEG